MQLHHVVLHIRVRAVLVAIHIIVTWEVYAVAVAIVEVLQFVLREPVLVVAVLLVVRQHTTAVVHLPHVITIVDQALALMIAIALLPLLVLLPAVVIHQEVVHVPAVAILQAVVEVPPVQVAVEAALPAEAAEEDK